MFPAETPPKHQAPDSPRDRSLRADRGRTELVGDEPVGQPPGWKLPSPSWQAAPESAQGTGQAALPAYTWQAIKQPRKLNQEFYNFTKHHN